MRIKQVTLHNFRIYQGENALIFPHHANKNLFVISGYNGFGKTTFLTSLVWCLYGKQMQEVDRTFRDRIIESGGYRSYLEASLNRQASKQVDASGRHSAFSVSVLLEDVDIPEVTINELEIIRRWDSSSPQQEQLDIRIDGLENELVKDIGNELFIQDFILPKEIAKFFFFDAEKITSLAEIKSLEDKRQLSRAYSEVLGIKKYEDLRSNLMDLRLRYRKSSADPKNKADLDKLEEEIASLEFEQTQCNEKIEHKEEVILGLSRKADDLQERIFREGQSLSVEKLKELRQRREKLEKENTALKERFKGLLDLAPFAMVNPLMEAIHQQLQDEQEQETKLFNRQIQQKVESVKQAFDQEDLFTNSFHEEAKAYYQQRLQSLLQQQFKNFLSATEDEDFQVIHAFSRSELHEFYAIYQQLQSTYRQQTKSTIQSMKVNQAMLSEVVRELNKGESKENDLFIQKIREERELVNEERDRHAAQKEDLLKRQAVAENDLENCKRRQVELQKKIRVHSNLLRKDEVAARLIQELEEFVRRIKEEKRISLEEKILTGLQRLMHKADFITKVTVVVTHDIIDILLYDSQEQEIHKEDLSKGEQQLYATAILKALVEESNIDFPVFIDSPLQKFDAQHAENIIRDFYPHISKQVVILPLLKKEITQKEYQQMLPMVASTTLIESKSAGASGFRAIPPEMLFKELEASDINQQAQPIPYV